MTHSLTSIMTLLLKHIRLAAYPVGSLYTSSKSTDPHELFGGKWKPIQDTFLWCAGPKHAAGTTGGAETHTLTIEEMPAHSHTQYVTANPGAGTYDTRLDWNQDAQKLNIYPQVQTGSAGGGSLTRLCRLIGRCTHGSARPRLEMLHG